MAGETVTSALPEFNATEFLFSILDRISETVNLEVLQSFFNQDSVVSKWVVTTFSIVLTLIFVCAFVAFGWWIVWICFLSRFKFVRELLLGNNTTPPPEDQPRAATSPPSTTNRRPKRKTRTD